MRACLHFLTFASCFTVIGKKPCVGVFSVCILVQVNLCMPYSLYRRRPRGTLSGATSYRLSVNVRLYVHKAVSGV